MKKLESVEGIEDVYRVKIDIRERNGDLGVRNVFFCQAEDGIRDRVRSRELGDM